MDAIENIFHMNGGDGDESYAKNSTFQRKALDMVKHITIDAITDLYITTTRLLSIADLGSSSGPNTLSVVRDLIEAVDGTSHNILRRPTPEFKVFLNDLPSNNFNCTYICRIVDVVQNHTLNHLLMAP
ncbi:SAM dependent carboxyl methyltransferase [Macleaya cordata]|uniref:SAM dependent carboxyl methyltransferase n=1 Tax=Macleaya cordata TaxID=56857 RepID=A0A200QT84_MACCD|nr:SAM dependent carboxyl methyltransferase [Macleaya cordata]